jgi:hypothetical protein
LVSADEAQDLDRRKGRATALPSLAGPFAFFGGPAFPSDRVLDANVAILGRKSWPLSMTDQDQDFFITLHGLQEALKVLDDVEGHAGVAIKRANYRIATRVRDTSQTYAPRSPTLADFRKLSGKPWVFKKARGTSLPKAGGLERSIDFDFDAEEASIFVSANSEAGAYAFRIHELKGIEWHNRGIGTESKGSKADDKFIVRAIKDEANAAFVIIEDEVTKTLKGL